MTSTQAMTGPSRLSGGARVAVLLTALFSICSCCSSDREPVIDPEAAKYGGAHAFLADRAGVEGALKHAADHRANILILSGGGRNGAWGAGFIRGWGQYGRPGHFDVITAISTGSLQSTYVLLLTDADEDLLERAYTTTSNKHVYDERGILSALFGGNALADTEPLSELLEKTYLTNAIIDRVANEAGHRRLYVGTVDLDAGETRIWDMVKIARHKCYDLYRRVILAATAVPVEFPPVVIEHNLHVDAGVREQAFLRDILIPACAADYADKKAAEPSCQKPALWVLVNGGIGVNPRRIENCLLPIAARSVEVLLDEAMVGNLYRIHATAKANGELHFNLAHMPSPPIGGAHDFDPAVMRALYEQGLRAWPNYAWKHTPPGL